jgi:hypothetical protein
MKSRAAAAALGLGLALASAAAAAPHFTPRAEPVRGVRFGPEILSLRVDSNGCTEKKSFDLRTTPAGGAVQVTLVRVKPDWCRALVREGVVLTWSLRELGIRSGQKIVVMNDVASRRGASSARIP